jgi:uncharacterized protein (DUF362 family)
MTLLTGNSIQNKVSVLKTCEKDIQQDIRNGINLIGGLKLRRDCSVIIKPNLCCIKPPETGATTDVRVVEGIVNYLKNEFGISDISIVESNGTQVLADMAFKLLGYEKLSKKLSVKLVNLSTAPFLVKKFPENALLKEIKFPYVFENADFFISVPKIKTHMDCVFTCAVKNQFGCNPVSFKEKYHKRLDDAIVDLNIAFRPDLVVVDGIVAMEGWRGPTAGLPVKMNTLIFGTDPVAVDHFVARVMGFDPRNISYIVEAEKRGLGNAKYTAIGVDIKEIKRKFKIIRPKLSNFYCIFQRY